MQALAANPDVLIYVGPGIVLAVIGLVGYWLKRRTGHREDES